MNLHSLSEITDRSVCIYTQDLMRHLRRMCRYSYFKSGMLHFFAYRFNKFRNFSYNRCIVLRNAAFLYLS